MEAHIEVCRTDLETLAITLAAEHEAVCNDRSHQAARNQNSDLQKHQEIADGAHGTRNRGGRLLCFAHKKNARPYREAERESKQVQCIYARQGR